MLLIRLDIVGDLRLGKSFQSLDNDFRASFDELKGFGDVTVDILLGSDESCCSSREFTSSTMSCPVKHTASHPMTGKHRVLW